MGLEKQKKRNHGHKARKTKRHGNIPNSEDDKATRCASLYDLRGRGKRQSGEGREDDAEGKRQGVWRWFEHGLERMKLRGFEARRRRLEEDAGEPPRPNCRRQKWDPRK
ncbi:hypothetical protein V8G54_034604 [Vigna mungo]|uniref:Uncharacterized protein n=1 Tax=Vigna mungo TaxID=3915 RepID=A0AAQ3RIN0_VIGMU